MLNKFYRIILFLAFSWAMLSSPPCLAWHDYAGYGNWDYHGSGRDHPYSAYIDRHSYVGYADYAPIPPDYIDGPLVLHEVTGPALPVLALSPAQTVQMTVNIPNSRGGYNAVVIKKSGDGYIGPDGEYYPEFPKIFQLQMKYGK